MKELEDKVKELKDDISEEQDKFLQLEENTSRYISTYSNGKYTDAVRECCISLLSLGVSTSKVDATIRTVLKLAEREADRLPSPTLVKNMAFEAGVLSKIQIGELIPMKKFNTLHTDGTTKFGQKFGAYEISTVDGSYSLALCEMKSGCATDSLDTLDSILEDIKEACQSVGIENAKESIVTTIKNTMSDRHSAEKKFNSLLEDYRENILTRMQQEWENMSNDEQSALTRLNHFFCGMHFMVAMADQANDALIHIEKVLSEGIGNLGASKISPTFCSSKESGTVHMIRTVCSAVQKHGSQRAGAYLYFAQFLKDRGIESMPLATFRGNRFNIVFYDAAGIYHLYPFLLEFFKSYGTDNPLLKAVLADLNEPIFLAGCKALGLINKLVTGPLWRTLESDISILEINKVYTKLRDKFCEWSADSTEILEGANTLFDASCYKQNDPVFLSLLKDDNDVNENTLIILQIIFKAFHLLCEHMLVDHLPGGIHDNDTVAYREETRSVPKTNTISERDFALLDRFIRERPNSTTIAIESLVLFSNNKTRKWLEMKSQSEKAKLFQAARKLGPKFKRKYKKRKEEIEKHRRKIIEERDRERRNKEKKDEKRRKDLVDEILMIGLWQSADEVEKELRKVKSVSQKKKRLKTQINFRRYVLLQEHSDKSLFKFSRKGKSYTVSELQSNLCELQNNDDPEQELPTTSINSNDPILNNPALLVGKQVEHRFLIDEEEQEYQSFTGTVISQIRVGRNKSFFNIKYAEDFQDKYWTYDLLEDYIAGDLIVTPHHPSKTRRQRR